MRTFGTILVRAATAIGLAYLVSRVAQALGITIAWPWRPSTCDDPGPTTGCGPNPRQCGATAVTVSRANGAPAEYPTCGTGPHTLVVAAAGFIGLDAAARAELRFAPTPIVTIRVVLFGNPGRIEAFEANGPLADVRMMAPTKGVEQSFELHGNTIDRLVVTPASPNDQTLVLGWCH